MAIKKFTPPPRVRTYRSNTNGFFLGTVINNKDSENKGRIQVDFHNVEHHGNQWYEVLASNAGGGGGVHMTPAKGDTVVAGFIDNKIYIFGCIHQGKDVKGHAYSDPNVFAITSRKKSALEFNDNENDGSVNLHDAHSSIYMDGKDTMTIKVPKILNILCGEKEGERTGIQIDGSTGTITIFAKNINIGNSKEANDYKADSISIKAEELFIGAKNFNVITQKEFKTVAGTTKIGGGNTIIN